MRLARAWVVGLLTLLCVPALVGFDLWPLTGWRLFSLSRDATQIEWALDAHTPTGVVHVDLEALPLAFRNAAWPLANVPKASNARKRAVCVALLDGVVQAIPDAEALDVVREHQRMVHDHRVVESRDVIVGCQR